ncbi:hypothetical protein AAZX31_06G202100 [Glycine max]|nr:hypothetical protein JHK85_016361 [Glycine max]KAG5046583.1 hypothetical protein JHK86_015989 [Glycine max]KAG5149084.1 hypothetical protein JHK82_015965 [Glycine max]
MALTSKAINQECKKHACGNKDGDWYLYYAPTACTEGDDHKGNGDSCFGHIAYMKGDDDGDIYDYAPAA